MKEVFKDYAPGVAILAGIIGIPLLLTYSPPVEQTCNDYSIKYEITSSFDVDIPEGEEVIDTQGVDGAGTVCIFSDDSPKTKVVNQEPIGEVKRVGTPSYLRPAPVREPPTTCRDGSYSWSTGSGTCSWHGGISHYNY